MQDFDVLYGMGCWNCREKVVMGEVEKCGDMRGSGRKKLHKVDRSMKETGVRDGAGGKHRRVVDVGKLEAG